MFKFKLKIEMFTKKFVVGFDPKFSLKHYLKLFCQQISVVCIADSVITGKKNYKRNTVPNPLNKS